MAAFNSQHEEIKKTVNMFYSHDGPEAIVLYWNKELRYKSNGHTFVNAAVDVVLARTKSELGTRSERDSLRLSAKSVCGNSLQSFQLSYIEKIFCDNAPHLTRLLSGWAFKDNRNSEEIPAHVAVIGSMLLNSYSQKSNYFQMVMGLYLHSSGCPKRVLSVLAALGLSVYHSTVMNALDQLTDSAMEELREAILKYPFFILYDNINFPNRKYDQRSHNKDTFENGTTATIVIGGGLGRQQTRVLLTSDR